MKYIGLAVLVLLSFRISAQNFEIDSLKLSLKQIENRDEYSKLLMKIGAKVMIYNSENAFVYSDKLDSIYKEHNHELSHLLALQLEAKILRWSDKPQKAIQKYIELLSISKDSLIIANVEFNLGIIYTNLRLNSKALEAFDKSLNIYKNHKKLSNLPNLYNCLADVYNYNLFEYEKAEELYLQAISSFIFLDETQKNSTESIQTLSVIHNNLGRLYIYLEKYKSAEKHLIQSRDLADSMNDRIGCLHSTITLAELYNSISLFKRAYNELYVFHEDIHSFSQYLKIEFYREWSRALAGKGNYKLAYSSNLLYTKLKDSLYNAETSVKLTKAKDDFEINNDNLEEKSELKSISLTVAIIFISSSIIAFLLSYFVVIRNKKESNTKLERIKSDNNELKMMINNVNHTLNSNLLEKVIERINEVIKSSEDSNIKNELRSIVTSIKVNIKNEELEDIFDKLNKDFFKNLQKNHPSLTANDRKISALLRLQLSSSEISQMMKIEQNSVNVAKSRLRKKLNIQPELDIYSYLSKF